MTAGIRALGVFRAIRLCELYAKVRRNKEEILLVEKEAKQYLEYMRGKRSEVLDRLDKVEISLLAIDSAGLDYTHPLEMSQELKVYAIAEEDAKCNKLYLRGVQAVLKRSLDYYSGLSAKGQVFFKQIVVRGNVADLHTVGEVVDLNAHLEGGGELDADAMFSPFE